MLVVIGDELAVGPGLGLDLRRRFADRPSWLGFFLWFMFGAVLVRRGYFGVLSSRLLLLLLLLFLLLLVRLSLVREVAEDGRGREVSSSSSSLANAEIIASSSSSHNSASS